jgi:RNA polymerase sigma-70 factor (ECF subfamily)
MDMNQADREADATSEELTGLFQARRAQLRRMVALRMDRRLQGRIDPSDVLQEAFLEASQRYPEYLRQPSMPLFLWLRFLTAQRLSIAHRRHLGAKARDAAREVSLLHGAWPEASSELLASQLIGRITTPTQALQRVELQYKLQQALNSMEPIDREILALRHFEQLTNAETAVVLSLKETAASNRYVRAIKHLKEILMLTPGFE